MYFAMGSGVTPNQASSVIQMPLPYCSQILKRWNQYLCVLALKGYVVLLLCCLRTSSGVPGIGRHASIDLCLSRLACPPFSLRPARTRASLSKDPSSFKYSQSLLLSLFAVMMLATTQLDAVEEGKSIQRDTALSLV